MATVSNAGLLTYYELNQQILKQKGISNENVLCDSIAQKFFKYDVLENRLYKATAIVLVGFLAITVVVVALPNSTQPQFIGLLFCHSGFGVLTAGSFAVLLYLPSFKRKNCVKLKYQFLKEKKFCLKSFR